VTFLEFAFAIIAWVVVPVVLGLVTFPDRIRQRLLLRGIRRGVCRDAVLRRCTRFGVHVEDLGSRRLRLWSTASAGFVSTTGAFADVAFDGQGRVLYVR
jgi:hypothetical protein